MRKNFMAYVFARAYGASEATALRHAPEGAVMHDRIQRMFVPDEAQGIPAGVLVVMRRYVRQLLATHRGRLALFGAGPLPPYDPRQPVPGDYSDVDPSPPSYVEIKTTSSRPRSIAQQLDDEFRASLFTTINRSPLPTRSPVPNEPQRPLSFPVSSTLSALHLLTFTRPGLVLGVPVVAEDALLPPPTDEAGRRRAKLSALGVNPFTRG